ncbi:hypothetical protein CPB86DRAFT_799563 [Serendipita vermifera]|nr:hypothetical protein CPB86DRAFT_799563 [Serendipita vermifera]
MAEASSSAMSQAALQLRDAAKRTIRRKEMSVNGQLRASRPGSSASQPPRTAPPLGPRGVQANTMDFLDYGDPNEDKMEVQQHQSDTSTSQNVANSTASGGLPSLTQRRARASRPTVGQPSTAKNGLSKEEGEISDEDPKAKRAGQSLMSRLSTETPAENLIHAETANLSRSKPQQISQTPLIQLSTASLPPKPESFASGIATLPRRPPTYPDPMPTSFFAPDPQLPPSITTSTASSPPRTIRTPSTNTHTFENFDDYPDGGSDIPLSPNTVQRNREFFTQLLKLGVDDKHCRPGLPMTFQQFKTAKALILDLLGFGMTPEDIANIGLNRRLVIYCLRELKIRLPSNITVDDIVPYEPPSPTMKDSNIVPSSHSSPRSFQDSPLPMDEAIPEHPLSPPADPPDMDSSEVEPSVKSESSIPEANNVSTTLNVHAAPFVPSLHRQTTGPSLIEIALPHQQIQPLPSRELPKINPPSSLPLRSESTVPSSSRKKSVSEPPPTEIPTPSRATESPTDRPEQPTEAPRDNEQSSDQRASLLLREQQAKMELLRRKLQLRKKRTDGTSTPVQGDVPVNISTVNPLIPHNKDHDVTAMSNSPLTISPTAMEVDEGKDESSTTPSDSNSSLSQDLIKKSNSIAHVAPPNDASLVRTAITRSLTNSGYTRPSTPSETGPKRGIKRPKADDFVEDMPLKRSNSNSAPIRSSFALLNAAPPEQHVITWIDDENVEISKLQDGQQIHMSMTRKVTVESDAAQFAAAALAIGLPMTAAELEAARLQEEERRTQLNAKSKILLAKQVLLKKLELKQAEKKLKMAVDNMNISTTSQGENIESKIAGLRKELVDLETRLAEQNGLFTPGAASSPIPNSLQATAPDTPNSESNKQNDIPHGVDTSPWDQSPPLQEAASQTRFRAYRPPAMLSAASLPQDLSITVTPYSDDFLNRIKTMDQDTSTLQRTSTGYDVDRRLCQYEVVGGICRDEQCQDLHFKDFQ